MKGRETQRIIPVPDVHRRQVDKKAWGVLLGVLRDVKPQWGVIMGDFMNMTALDPHGKKKPDETLLKKEYEDANRGLDEIQDASPNTKWDYLEGNHEHWAWKYACRNPALADMLTVSEKLCITRGDDYHRVKVDLRGMNWVPYRRGQRVIHEGVLFCHGYGGGANPARKYAQTMGPRYGCRTVVYGHHHSFGYHCTDAGYQAFGAGFLGKEDEHEFDYMDGPSSWNLGFNVLEVSGGLLNVTQVPIAKGRALYGGKVVRA